MRRLRKRVVKERFGVMRAGAETIKRTREGTTKKGTWEKREEKKRSERAGEMKNDGKKDRIFKTKRLRKRVVKERFGDMRAGAEMIKRRK